MERQKAEAVIEAVLFTMGDSVEIARLAEAVGENVEETKKILEEMRQRGYGAIPAIGNRTGVSR